MVGEYLLSKERKQASLRLCNVSSFMTELLELSAENPSLHVVIIPGNPGVVQFYKHFVEGVYEMLDGCASVTAIGHISQTKKVAFINQEIQNTEIPIFLVGHSIGSHMSLEVFRSLPERVKYCVGLYPFLSSNKESVAQKVIEKISMSSILCSAISCIVSALGLLPRRLTRFLVKRSVGKSWSTASVEALCGHLLQYHTMRNILFLAKTEFEKFAQEPDWIFMKEKQDQISFLFGIDDHWGPLTMFEEISKKVPNVALSIEKEGHTHSFSCTEAGSVWLADHVVSVIKHQLQVKADRVKDTMVG
ncbi:lipid droplet-associated hydrolase isoform X2 [Papaver somniferum]|uniref:lipid droplet-associated hydrolase isoform X2 n=1 Tax=Papaver somniferum TaxID=3469 RepID=UPI000E6F9A86|nr:lipid droplet-associated hydrolase isoform X2 [Papaver somniferum]